MARNLSITAFALLVLAVLLQNGPMLGAAAMLAGAVLISVAWGRRIGGALEVARQMNARAYLNDKIDVILQVRNRSRLPAPWLRIRDSVPVEVGPHSFNRAISLKGKETRLFHYTLLANRRGFYRVGPVSLYAGDVLGLDDVLNRQAVVQTLTVYPKIVSLEALGLPSRSPLGSLRETQPIFEDPSRVRGKREYSSGDSMRRVDWKTSAATGRLQVRQFEPSRSLEAMVMLDLNRANYDRLTWADDIELAIIAAASICNWVVARKEAVGLATNGLDPGMTGETSAVPKLAPFQTIAPAKGRGHFMTALDVLARVRPADPPEDFIALVQRERVKLAWGATLVFITGKMTDALFEEIFKARRNGMNASIVLCGRTVDGLKQSRQRAAYFGVPLYHIVPQRDMNVTLN
jgi:uncharacterized protein (DUF58 family)